MEKRLHLGRSLPRLAPGKCVILPVSWGLRLSQCGVCWGIGVPIGLQLLCSLQPLGCDECTSSLLVTPPPCLSGRHRQNCALWSFLRCLGIDSSCHHLYPLSPCHGDTGAPLRLTSCIVSSGSGALVSSMLRSPNLSGILCPSPPPKSFGPGWWWLEGRLSFQRPTPSNSMAFLSYLLTLLSSL